jgi:chemotaxis protein methyltransferase CheR
MPVTEASLRAELERLRRAVGDHLGFAFEDDELEQLGHTLRARVAALALPSFDAYLTRLKSGTYRAEETAALAELFAVTETFFCRNQEQIQALVDAVLPRRAPMESRRLRIVSAGCASGEEPYSIAIALREALPDLDSWDVKIFALDVNQRALERAERARYSAWSLRATPEPIKARYFTQAGSEFVLDERVQRLVEFREHNLADPEPLFLRALAADAIFCRNVIMYFTPEAMRRVVADLSSALLPGGLLFLGHAETLRGLSHDYHLCHTHGTFYYELKERPPVSSRRRPDARPSPTPESLELPAGVEGSSSWLEAIRAASQRITARARARAQQSSSSRDVAALDPEASARSELSRVFDLVERERFDEALVLLDGLPAAAGAHPDALLLSAVLLTNAGRLNDAERACRRLLEADELHAGAHYLTALCREHAGDALGAAAHDRMAVHLDPSFAMPHLHAGLVAKRRGALGTARHELEQALMLLEREDTSRLVLFGGGFSRAALTALCRSELGRLGSGG